MSPIREHQCSGPCGQTFPWTNRYFHKKGKGALNGRCKKCRNADQRKQQGRWKITDRKRQRTRARHRAMRRLAQAFPELYDLIYAREMARESEMPLQTYNHSKPKLDEYTRGFKAGWDAARTQSPVEDSLNHG